MSDMLVPIGGMLLIFYFILWRPQAKERRNREEMLKAGFDEPSTDKALSETLYGLHGAVGWTIIALIAIHISAALMHGFIKRDTVMKRMSLF